MASTLRIDLVEKARKVRDDSIAAVQPPVPTFTEADLPANPAAVIESYLSEDERRITSMEAVELLTQMRAKTLTCEAVVRAFLRRAAVAHKLTNCLTELLPERAIARARHLDSLQAPAGALHGLPISMKEHTGMKGGSSNASVVSFVADPPSTDRASIWDALEEAGAVVFARTTQPQSIMHLETNSVLYGLTVNAHNRALTSGGSSGGEGALIGLHASVLGVGTDIGGSIRDPAANNGVYGFKPTSKRIGASGSKRVFGGQEGIPPTAGPLATSRAALSLFMQVYLASEPWLLEDDLVPLPWRVGHSLEPASLKIGVIWNDGVVQPAPPVARALREVVASLKAAGTTVVDWKPIAHDDAWEITHSLYYEEGGKRLRSVLAAGGEPLLPMTEWILTSGKNKADGKPHVQERSADNVLDLKVRRNNYRAAHRKQWLESGVDAILCPVGPGPAPPHNNAKYWAYTSQWNLLDHPAAVFPVTTVDRAVDTKVPAADFKPLSADDEFIYNLYDPALQHGQPICLQIVTPRFTDEKCLSVLEAVEKAMGRK